MIIDPSLSEEMNLLLHINEVTEFPFELSDLVFGIPRSTLPQPNKLTERMFDSFSLEAKNSEVLVSASPNSKLYKDSNFVKPYRRVHIGAQWLLSLRNNPTIEKIDGRIVVFTNSWTHDNPTMEEVNETLKRVTKYRMESLTVEVLDYTNNRYNPDTGKIRIKPIRNSLLYIGSLEIDVVYKPISFMPKYLPGFVDYK